MPGVQINREAEGRQATVNLRSMPGGFAKTTRNGVAFAEPILQNSTPLGAFLSDMFSAMRVEKTPLPHSQSVGVSGNIDLQIANALSRNDGFRVKAGYDLNELGDRSEPSLMFGVDKHFSDDVAVFATAAGKR